jgi:nucleotide-binding universal stress UspA family protein/predicted DNA-binding antitoxin AbrB/MazE fold protein
MDDCLKVLISASYQKAKIISSQIEALGIECFFKGLDAANFQKGAEVKIYVKENDLANAKEILKGFLKEIPEVKVSEKKEIYDNLILVPVDFTQASLNAIYFALELADKFDASIKMIHTYGLPEIRPISFDDTDFYSGTLTAYIAEMRQEAEKKFEELLKQIHEYIVTHKLADIPISTAIINGLPDEITTYTADTEKAGLILMGISHKDVRTFEPIGKIASRIVEKAKSPVLIIPEDSSFKGIDQIKNVLYPTAFDETDFISIQRLLRVIEKLNSNIHILHISNNEGNPWDTIKMDGLREYFFKAYNLSNVSCELIVSKEILHALDEFIKKKDIDLIAMVTHKRNLIWKMINPSLTLKILYHTQVPLLVFHS